jgi:hypothetical protein
MSQYVPVCMCMIRCTCMYKWLCTCIITESMVVYMYHRMKAWLCTCMFVWVVVYMYVCRCYGCGVHVGGMGVTWGALMQVWSAWQSSHWLIHLRLYFIHNSLFNSYHNHYIIILFILNNYSGACIAGSKPVRAVASESHSVAALQATTSKL